MLFDLDRRILVDAILESFDVETIVIMPKLQVKNLTYATGMSSDELHTYLNEQGLIGENEYDIPYEALDILKEWQLNKVKRYYSNYQATQIDAGSEDAIIFSQFCGRYKKENRSSVRSWDDIDEGKILEDFERQCLGGNWLDLLFAPSLNGQTSILGRIRSSFLYHLRIRIRKHFNNSRVNTIIYFILCNRYHIFTSEADSHVDAIDYRTGWSNIFNKSNPHRSAADILSLCTRPMHTQTALS